MNLRPGALARFRGSSGAAGFFVAAALLGTLVFAARAASDVAAPSCPAGEHRAVEVGIVKAVGCWTQSTKEGVTIYTAPFESQIEGVDLNGFVLTGQKGGALQVNAGTREVTSVALTEGPGNDQAQINSRNWPLTGQLNTMGSPIKIDFIAPEKSSFDLEDLHLGSNTVARALAGLSPVGDIETPIELEEGGKGSMNLTISLAGVFTLKGHPQSVTIALPTESEKGTHLDGFELDLKEIDTFKVITINELSAKYSASEKVIAGSAVGSFNFSKAKEKGAGFGLGFNIDDGVLDEVKAQVSGIHIPIGAPPGGFVTALGGGFRLKNIPNDGFDLLIMANASAEIGPEIPTPWGKVAPIDVDASLQLGHKAQEFFFEIRGGVKIFRIPAGDVYLAIHSNSGVEFGVGLGVGFPSYSNNSKDPFYIGARVDGWVAKSKFQLEGSGRVALFGAKLFDGRVLVNDRAAGACWVVLGFPGGAVYEYGASRVKTFGVGCGLDDYKEKFPGNARISAGGSRTLRLTPAEGILAVRGSGGAPRFTLRSAGGRVLRTPVDRDSVIVRKGARHAFFVNEGTNTTHAIIPNPQGRWTIVPYADSAPITSVKAGRRAPKEKVTAEVRGRGAMRTLVWDSLDRAHTRLLFLERLPGGQEVPIFETGAPRGRHRFETLRGGNYGRRHLRVVVIHGYGSRQAGVVDDYRVSEPGLLAAPRHVTGWRDEHDVHVTWSGVKRAAGYLVEVTMRGKRGGRLTNFVRRASVQQRSVVIPDHPGGGVAVAKVFALNSDDKPGRPRGDAFQTRPPDIGLHQATRRAVASAVLLGSTLHLRTLCPEDGHCRTLVELRDGNRLIARQRFQQTPDTFRDVRIRPRSAAARRALRRSHNLRVIVRAHRSEGRARGLAALAG
jgi:hypothetical protein